MDHFDSIASDASAAASSVSDAAAAGSATASSSLADYPADRNSPWTLGAGGGTNTGREPKLPGEGECKAPSAVEESEEDSSDDESDGDSEVGEFAIVQFDKNPYSVQFALDCFNSVSGLTSKYPAHANDVWLLGDEADVAVKSGGKEVRVNRKPTVRLLRCLKAFKCRVVPRISFPVEQQSPKFAYIRYSDWAGIQYVYVERTREPTDMDWSRTMEFRILSTTQEAMSLCNSDLDEGINIGKNSLRTVLDALSLTHQGPSGTAPQKDSDLIFHQGSTYSSGDIRSLIGVVRWYPASQETPDAGYWTAKTMDYDVLKMGAPYVQKVARTRRGAGTSGRSVCATKAGRAGRGGNLKGSCSSGRAAGRKAGADDSCRAVTASDPDDSDDVPLSQRPGTFYCLCS
jgi:hypothetical protein